MRIFKKSSFSGIEPDRDGKIDPKELRRTVDSLTNMDNDLSMVFSVLQGRIRFGIASANRPGENIFGEWTVTSDTGGANTEFSCTHSLGIIPTGYLVTSISKAGVVYLSGTAWTATTAYFKCSVANAAVNIFLIP